MFVKFTRLDAILLHANSGPLKQTISFAIRAELIIFVHPVYWVSERCHAHIHTLCPEHLFQVFV